MQEKMWRVVDTGISTPERNMAIDEALLKNFKEDDLPILRLYRWKPSISLGRFSNLKKSVDLNVLEERGLSCVRRMTGGGILVHGDDLSYSLILPRKFVRGRGVKRSYHYICEFLILLYEKIGHKANFAADLKLDIGHSNICMASNEEYDIIIEDRKIGGNAQRHASHAFFQHGSIPLSMDKELFGGVFLENSGLDRAATLEVIGSSVKYKKLSELLIEAFCETFDVNILRDDLSQSEMNIAEELYENKYSKKRWNINAESFNA